MFFCCSCDLAGSERIKKAGVEGERLSELQHVNLSLLELGLVCYARLITISVFVVCLSVYYITAVPKKKM